MIEYQLKFETYKRPLAKTLRTNHGFWSVREGIIVTLIDADGKQSFGEIAPLPQFGTERLPAAIALCSNFNNTITKKEILAISDQFPACQFGFGSALMGFDWQPEIKEIAPTQLCQLIPETMANKVDTEQIQGWLAAGHNTFKVKLPCWNMDDDIALCEKVLSELPKTSKLRLDANGGLYGDRADILFQWADSRAQIEFIEQPLEPDKWQDILALSYQYKTAIALDESVSTIASLNNRYYSNSKFIYVVKPAIMGFPSRFRDFCDRHPEVDLVFSTVFETAVGHQFITRLAQAYGNPQRAFGFGGTHWFKT